MDPLYVYVLLKVAKPFDITWYKFSQLYNKFQELFALSRAAKFHSNSTYGKIMCPLN